MDACASAPASSSQAPCPKYDVFISFRGPDVRSGFLSHLEKEMRQKNIEFFVDDRLESGDEISSALVKAIEESIIALVIFSKDYASSRWCLEELVKIMECKEVNQQIVIPVFYLVNPSDVRYQKDTYAEAFTHHENMSNDKVEIWRSVLRNSANLSGHTSSELKSEAKLVEEIVQDVLKKREKNSPSAQKSQLIGFHENFTSVELLMETKSQEVRMVGIWGMGGVGKTTLARAIFDKFLSQFDHHYFLENVREKSAVVGLTSLRKELLSKLLELKDHQDSNDPKMIERLQREKVLLVLDDVNSPKQLKDLLRGLHFGIGSRTIVTSRDKQVLRNGRILEMHIHEVSALNLEKSLELFSRHAFNQSDPKMGYEELSKMTVTIAKGIPLALEVLGSHFYSRNKAYWQSELNKLKEYPHQDIQNVLKISYDALDDMDKEIFLDIAYFHVGEYEDEIVGVLESNGFEAVSGTQNLIDKALIKLEFGRIVMHDLILEMAEQIVRKNCNPEARSRLKDEDEIQAIWKSNMGTFETKGIIMRYGQREGQTVVRADFLSKMRNLRMLKMHKIVDRSFLPTVDDPFFSEDLEPLPDKIRYLYWTYFEWESLPSGSYFENLVELHMKDGYFKKLWDEKQSLPNLKKINLARSEYLEELPDLSLAQRLEIVDLHGCTNLRSVHPSILSLHTIVKIDVSECHELRRLESETHLESLSHLNVDGCCELNSICLSSKKLRCLDLRSSHVEKLNFPIGRFTELRELSIYGGRLKSLPIKELCDLKKLEVFILDSFRQQVISTMEINSLIGAWPNLIELCLDRSDVETLPACVCQLSSLRSISLQSCYWLKSILGLPPSIQQLDASHCLALVTVSSTSQLQNKCRFSFPYCRSLDESSIRFLVELTYSSVTLAHHDEDDLEHVKHVALYTGSKVPKWIEDDLEHVKHVALYTGSKVPHWMKYKEMTYASNVVEFTCNLERSSLTLVLCCVARYRYGGHRESGLNPRVFCRISFDDNYKFSSTYDNDIGPMVSYHVFLWSEKLCSILDVIEKVNDVKIKCEFFVSYDYDTDPWEKNIGEEDDISDWEDQGIWAEPGIWEDNDIGEEHDIREENDIGEEDDIEEEESEEDDEMVLHVKACGVHLIS